jgi:hypothetical protein
LAVGLAVFSGLRPGQVKGLAFRNLVEFSTAGKKFSHVPSRIEIETVVGNRRITFVRFYTFLSRRGCRWLLEDLKTRSQSASAYSPVVAAQSFREAEKAVHAAGLKWFDLRDYFHQSFMVLDLSSRTVRFMLGHPLKEWEKGYMDAFNPKAVSFLRRRYAKVERQFFI